MKKLFENFKLFENSLSQLDRYSVYFDKAIAAADTYEDYGWTIDDFFIEDLGKISLEQLESMVGFGNWVINEPTEVENLPPEKRVEGIPELGSPDKQRAALLYIKQPQLRPPVVLVTAPDSNNDSLYTRLGFGHGLINLNISLGIPEISVFHLHYKHSDDLTSNNRRPSALAGPPGRLR